MSSSKDLKGLLNEDGLEDELNLDIESLGLKINDIFNSLPAPTTTNTTTSGDSNTINEESEEELKESDLEEDVSSDYLSPSSLSSSEEEEDSSEDDEEIKKATIIESRNIAFPKQTPSQIQTQKKSFLSNKKIVNFSDRFDMDDYTNGSIKKKKPKQLEREYEEDTDEEDNDDNMVIDNPMPPPTQAPMLTETQPENTANTTTTTTTTTTSQRIRSSGSKKKSKKQKAEVEIRISKEVRKLLSKGNEQYTKGQFAEAFLTFAEVVRISPRLSIPYNILGKIKEQQGEHKEALGFYIYGAQIQATNSELWANIAHKAKNIGESDTALYCFTRAFRNDQSDLNSLWERGQILIEKGFHKRALKGLVRLNKLRPHDSQILQELARVYSHLSQYHDASALIGEIVDVQLLAATPLEEISLDSINLMMELKNKTRNYHDTIQIFNKIVAKYGKESDVPIDLIFNVCQAYYSLGTEIGYEKGAKLLNGRLISMDPGEIGDLFYSLADELLSLGRYSESLTVLLRLKGSAFDTPNTWVKIADCYRNLKNYPAAIEYFEKANEKVPGNVKTTLAMSEIYREMGDHEKALHILNHSSTLSNRNEQSEKELFENTLKELNTKRDNGGVGINGVTKDDVKLLYRHAQAYLNLSKYSQYLGIATALLYGSNDKYIYRRKVGVGLYKKKKRLKRIKNSFSLEMYKHQQEHPYAELLEEEDYFNLLLDTSKILNHLNRQQESSPYLRYVLRNIHFENGLYSHQLKFLIVAVSFSDKNYYQAYKYVKYVCSKKPYDNRVWNLFNKILVNYGSRSTAIGRFLSKLQEKYPDSIPTLVMLGNQSKQTDNARGALFEYLKAYKLSPNDPLINLLISILILSQSMGRKQSNRHRIAITSFSFLYKYFNLRGECQESFYNLGRGFHQLGIYNLAIDYYNKVLEHDDEYDDEGEIDKSQSLKCEAAFNLSLIYKSKGNTNLANDILNKYIVI